MKKIEKVLCVDSNQDILNDLVSAFTYPISEQVPQSITDYLLLYPKQKVSHIDDQLKINFNIVTHLSSQSVFDYFKPFDNAKNSKDLIDLIPDLLIISLKMPNKNGVEILQHIHTCLENFSEQFRLNLSDVPVIFLNKNAQFSTYMQSHPPKVLGVFGKPFDPKYLLERILKLWGQFYS